MKGDTAVGVLLVLTASMMVAFGIASAWPTPALDVSPVHDRDRYGWNQPFQHTTPASYERTHR